jgi:glycosyltransferase involved in cell wall biosynthesis
MRIAVWHNLPSGGGKRALYEHVRGLVGRGHTIEAWCPPTANREFLPLDRLIPERVVDLAWPPRFRRSDRWQITLAVERSLRAMDAHCRKCADEINRGGFDILFANSCQFFRATPIGRYVNLPSVIYQGEPYRWLYEALPRLRWLAPPAHSQSLLHPSSWRSSFVDWRSIRNWRVQAREEVDNAAAFTKILVNSYFSRESMLRAYGIDADVCYLGIDPEHFSDRNLPRDDYVIGVGSMTEAKNAALAIEAVAAIPAPRPRLVWVSNLADGGYRDAMIDLAKKRDVTLDMRMAIPDEHVVDLLNRAFAMVYPPRLEPFGLAPLEANACGLPVVAVPEGGVRESIRHGVNGLLSEPDPASMALAIVRLREDPRFARQIGATGRELVKREWSLEAATDRIEQRLKRYAAGILRSLGQDKSRKMEFVNPAH